MYPFGRLQAKVYAEIGGYKRVKRPDLGRELTLQYSAANEKHFRIMEVTFDTVAPKHCSETNTCRNGATSHALSGLADITKVQ